MALEIGLGVNRWTPLLRSFRPALSAAMGGGGQAALLETTAWGWTGAGRRGHRQAPAQGQCFRHVHLLFSIWLSGLLFLLLLLPARLHFTGSEGGRFFWLQGGPRRPRQPGSDEEDDDDSDASQEEEDDDISEVSTESGLRSEEGSGAYHSDEDEAFDLEDLEGKGGNRPACVDNDPSAAAAGC